jgi:hypothetical protein
LQSKTYTLSAKFSGNENANGVGLTLAVFIGDNSGQYIQVGPLADQAPDSATYGSIEGLAVESLQTFGHSYVEGVGAGDYSAGDNGTTSNKKFVTLLAAALGLPLRQGGVSGTQLTYSNARSWVKILQTINAPIGFTRRPAIYMNMWGINDLNVRDNTTAALAGFVHDLRTVISRQRAGAVMEETDGSFSYGSGWTSSTGVVECSGTSTKYTTTEGATYTITTPADFPGGTLAIGITSRNTNGAAGTGAVHTAVVDGVAQAALDARNYHTGASGTMGCVYRIKNLTAGAHTIVVTVTSVLLLTQVDYWQWETSGPDAPLVLLPLQPYPVDYSAYSSGTIPTDAGVDALNGIITSVAAEFDSRVITVDLSAMNKVAAMFATDKLHPSTQGHRFIYSQLLAAVRNAGVRVGFGRGGGQPPRQAWGVDPALDAIQGQDIHSVGEIRWNTAPGPAAPLGWVWTVAGLPGTWQAFGSVSDFAYNFPPEMTISNVVPGITRTVYARVTAGGTISKVRLNVVTSSGNISVAAYRNTGSGTLAQPGTQLAASGAVVCPAVGVAEISLGATITLAVGDWLAFSADNATVALSSLGAIVAAGARAAGRMYYQDSTHPCPAVFAGSAGIVGPIWLGGVP